METNSAICFEYEVFMIIYSNMNIDYNEYQLRLRSKVWYVLYKYVYSEGLILLSETGSCSVNGLHERCLFKSWGSSCKNSSVKDDLTGAPSLEQDCLAAPAAGGYGKPLGRRVLLDPTSITRLTTGQTVKQRTYLHINTT